MKDANVSVINQTAAKLRTSSGRKLQTIMGGEQIGDYANSGSLPYEQPEE
jgi:hypothetical protein